MGGARLGEIEGGTVEAREESTAEDLLQLAAQLGGLEQILSHPAHSPATAREELWAAAEIVGFVLQMLRSDHQDHDGLDELENSLVVGRAALVSAAEHPDDHPPWHETCAALARTRRLLVITAAGTRLPGG